MSAHKGVRERMAEEVLLGSRILWVNNNLTNDRLGSFWANNLGCKIVEGGQNNDDSKMADLMPIPSINN